MFSLRPKTREPPTSPSGEGIAPARGLRLSRSPHPYNRRYSPGNHQDHISSSQKPSNPNAGQRTRHLTASPLKENAYKGEHYDDTDNWKRRRSSTSPSDSATEADDESGGVLRGLPAPPLRLRKGIKDTRGPGIWSPLLTPNFLDENERKLSMERQSRSHDSLQSPPLTDEERSRIQVKFTRKRRAEILRRLSETVLLGSVGCIACGRESESLCRTWWRELVAHGLVLSGTYILYPLRIIYGKPVRTSQGTRSRWRLRIPAAVDPAPLLYPTLIPVFVALSLAAVNPKLLLPNLILSIASIPRQVIPYYESFFGCGLVQWFLSTIPVAVFNRWTSMLPVNSPGMDLLALDPLSAENLTMLYPLHQALLPSLGYLTTTSLLPAELQLLSVSMINILFLSTSPQAFILKALLWIGGLSTFILCGTVLRSGVALARVPTWRFRHPRRRLHKGGSLLLYAMELYFDRYLRRHGFISGFRETSDSEDAEGPVSNMYERRDQKLRLKIDRENGNRPRADSIMPMSAVDTRIQNGSPNFTGTPGPSEMLKNKQRRHTLPSYFGWPTDSLVKKPTIPKRLHFPLNLKNPRSFMLLTEAQAVAVKWFYALYVYTAVLLIIAVPIRILVSHWALHNHEPVGWALGYLFGNLPYFRYVVSILRIGHWIPLPSPLANQKDWERCSWEEKLQTLGAANVRLLICLYCVSILVIGLRIVFRLTAFVEVDTRRKVFHGMMVVMFLPSILVDPPFAALALILVLAIFLLLDLFRASQLPPLSRPLTHFLAPYVDGRDHRGPVIVSHIFLLIGCAIPLWLSLAALPRTGVSPWEGWDVSTRDLGMISGVVCVGMGDAAASLIGRRFGRRRWCWSGGKSLEGSLAFAVAVVLGLSAAKLWLRAVGWVGEGADQWGVTLAKTAIAATGASMTEAVLTGGNDNVIVPVVLWLLVRGLEI
ncbi:hypothetical protein MMC22_006119 [Lobaria immixta]|nr:hypothetical protein [Lobaria immixta]